MRQSTSRLVAVLLVVGTLAVVPLAGLAAQTDTADGTATPSNGSNASDGSASVAPGAQLAGVVGVQQAELHSEVESRAYGIEMARASGNESRAAVAADRLASLDARLDDLERRREALRDARANGSMSEGEYRARTARLAAETRAVERLAEQSNESVRGLSRATLDAHGVNVTAIQALHDRAEELAGPEVARIARSIAGDRVGHGFGPEHAPDRGEGHENAGSERGGSDHGARENATDGPGDGGRGASDGRGPNGGATQTPTPTADATDRSS